MEGRSTMEGRPTMEGRSTVHRRSTDERNMSQIYSTFNGWDLGAGGRLITRPTRRSLIWVSVADIYIAYFRLGVHRSSTSEKSTIDGSSLEDEAFSPSAPSHPRFSR